MPSTCLSQSSKSATFFLPATGVFMIGLLPSKTNLH